MKKIKIWVDDVRPAPAGYKHFKTTNGVIDFLIHTDPKDIEVLDLDHDAGDYASRGGDYIHILDWMEYMNYSVPISIHSGNPVGINNMWRIIKKNNWTYIPREDEIYL